MNAIWLFGVVRFFEHPLGPEAFIPLIAEHVGDHPKRECWAVTAKSNEFVGRLQISYNFKTGQADLGRFIINPVFRGQGLARELSKLAVQIAFSRPMVHRIELRVYDFNHAAISSYQSAGFVIEGVRRESVRVGQEHWNTQIMGILRSDFTNLRDS